MLNFRAEVAGLIPVLKVPLALDLAEFTQFLWINEVPHRVTEEEGVQTLWVSPTVSVDRIKQLFEFWQAGGKLSEVKVQQANAGQGSQFSASALASIPVVLILILLSVIASLMIGFGNSYQAMNWLSFSDFRLGDQQIQFTELQAVLERGELWRIWTPIFMHFSVLHILFNLLWVWVIGQRVERLQGSSRLLMLVAFSGALSNFAQFVVSGPLFGGMSGVVFALLAYTWLWDRIAVRPTFGFPPMLMNFMIFWLVLGYTGFFEVVGMGAIANTAHLAGLGAGLVFALLARALDSGHKPS